MGPIGLLGNSKSLGGAVKPGGNPRTALMQTQNCQVEAMVREARLRKGLVLHQCYGSRDSNAGFGFTKPKRRKSRLL